MAATSIKIDIGEVIGFLKEKSNPAYFDGMRRYGINTASALGIRIPELRKLAREIKKNHPLALELWNTGIHEARILASMIDVPTEVTPLQMDQWVAGFDSWDLCDQVCGNLLVRTPYVIEKALEYSAAEKEFVKRAGFVLMAELPVHNKKIPDQQLSDFLPVIEREAWDNRNFVKKAVNWALRQIGKQNKTLNQAAINAAKRIAQQDSKAAKWIASDALAELTKRFSE